VTSVERSGYVIIITELRAEVILSRSHARCNLNFHLHSIETTFTRNFTNNTEETTSIMEAETLESFLSRTACIQLTSDRLSAQLLQRFILLNPARRLFRVLVRKPRVDHNPITMLHPHYGREGGGGGACPRYGMQFLERFGTLQILDRIRHSSGSATECLDDTKLIESTVRRDNI